MSVQIIKLKNIEKNNKIDINNLKNKIDNLLNEINT